jgi:Ca2+-binding EF-hand superfamily protein
MLTIKALVLAAGILAAPAVASPPLHQVAAVKKGKGDTLAALFKQLDTDKDGKLSPAEFAKLKQTQTANKTAKKKPAKNKPNKAKKGNKGDALFKKLDTNNDGSLSLAEFKKLNEVRAANKKAKPAKKANKVKKNA